MKPANPFHPQSAIVPPAWSPGACATALTLAALLLAGCDRDGQPGPGGSTPDVAPKTITTPLGIVMVSIPAGQFTMGEAAGEEDEKPVHKARVSAFFMDAREVTQQAYESLVSSNPSKSKSPEKPVEQVDWYHAVLYCNLRSLKEGLKPCYDPKTLACDFTASGYRLPTEAEWEYACRAGSTEKYSFGSDPARLKAYAWYKANGEGTTHAVGQKTPNAWGLYDMHGNVAEWCQDLYGEQYDRQPEPQDPRGPATGDKRVLRGGSWRAREDACRSAARHSENARFADACFGSDAYGFRCVRKAPEK